MSSEPPVLQTHVAHAGWDDHRYFGHSVFGELAGHESFTGLLAMSVSGRRLSPDDCRVLDDLATVMAVGDPRLFPLKAVRLVAAYGRVLPACAAGSVYLEDALIGAYTSGEAARFLVEIEAACTEAPGGTEQTTAQARSRIRETERLIGFGVPFREHDERMSALRLCLQRRGRDQRRYWRLLESVVEIVEADRGLQPNIGFGVAACCLDLGFDPRETAVLSTALIHHLFVANAVEGARQCPAELRSLPARYVDYQGVEPRVSPRKQRR